MSNYIETEQVSFQDFRKQVLDDYRLGRISREASYLTRKEVLTGKAKFGIVGDGKELMWSANPLRQGDRCRAILRLVL